MITTESPSMLGDNLQANSDTENATAKKNQKVPNRSKPSPKKNIVYLFIIALIVIGSVYWTHYILSQTQNNAQNEQMVLARINQIQNEKRILEDKINTLNQQDISDKRLRAQNTVFKGYLDIADWIYRLNEVGDKNGMKVEYQLFEGKQDDKLTDITVVPMEIRVLSSVESGTNSNYKQFLEFIQIIVDDGKYKKFTGAGIENQGQYSALLSLKIEVRKKSDELLADNQP